MCRPKRPVARVVSYERARVWGEAIKCRLVDSLIDFLKPALAEPKRDQAIRAIKDVRLGARRVTT
jgi:hypothetical protein